MRSITIAVLCFSSWDCAVSFSANGGGGGGASRNGGKDQRHITAAEKARREEEQRRKGRAFDAVPGKTSAIPGAKDFEINVQRTQLDWNDQASGSEREVREYTSKGLQALKMLQLEEADEAFNIVYQMKPHAYCWQAGVVKFYLKDYYGAAEIFAKNAMYYETKFGEMASEERIWRDACELKLLCEMYKQKVKYKGRDLDPPAFRIPDTDGVRPKETRKVLRIASDLFSSTVENDLSTTVLARAKLRSICGEYDGVDGTQNESDRKIQRNKIDRKMWRLNAWYYLGLHYDVTGDTEESKNCMKMAIRQCIGGNGSDIIHTLPMLHMSRRDWFDDDSFEEDDGFDFDAVDDPFDQLPQGTSNAVESIKESVNTMRLSALQKSLKLRGLKTSGSKSILKSRLQRCLLEDAGFE